MTSSKFIIPADYAHWLSSLKTRISGAQQRAALAVNQELVRLCHSIGSEILERQTRQDWGAKVIDRLANDLREAFPEMKGFSSRNLKYMKFFAQQCPSGLMGQQPAAPLPWFHLVTLLTKVSAEAEREWYAAQAIAQGWSRLTLDIHIKNRLHLRQAAAVTHFEHPLPAPHAQLKKQNRLVAEYALSGMNKPIGVAEYPLVRSLPEPLDTRLPTIEEIEAELAGDLIPPAPAKTSKLGNLQINNRSEESHD